MGYERKTLIINWFSALLVTGELGDCGRLLERHAPGSKGWTFGSRARGAAQAWHWPGFGYLGRRAGGTFESRGVRGRYRRIRSSAQRVRCGLGGRRERGLGGDRGGAGGGGGAEAGRWGLGTGIAAVAGFQSRPGQTVKRCRLGSVVSHPCARSARGWGTRRQLTRLSRWFAAT